MESKVLRDLVSSDIIKNSDPSPPTPNKIKFWANWVEMSAVLATTLLGGVGGRRMNPKPIKTLSCKEQSPTQKLLGRGFSHSPKFFCSPSIIVVVVLIRNLKSAETQGHPTINFDSPKNNNKAWMKLYGATLSILGECWEKIICSSLLARLLEVFPAGVVHVRPATWLTAKFPSRRRHTLLASLGVVIGKNSVTVDYHRHRTNDLLTESSKNNHERRTGQLTIWLTIDDCLTVTHNRRIETHLWHYESSCSQ